jgi:hypothetical protein
MFAYRSGDLLDMITVTYFISRSKITDGMSIVLQIIVDNLAHKQLSPLPGKSSGAQDAVRELQGKQRKEPEP